PTLRDRMRRDFENRAGSTRILVLAKPAMEVERARSRLSRGRGAARVAIDDRSEESRAPSARGEDRIEEPRRRRLSLGAGHADDRELAARPAEEGIRHAPERLAGARDAEVWNAAFAADRHLARTAFADDGGRAGANRVVDVTVSVSELAAHRDEELTFSDLARVATDPGDGHSPVSRGNLEPAPEKLLEPHVFSPLHTFSERRARLLL